MFSGTGKTTAREHVMSGLSCIRDRIVKDDISVEMFLPNFALAQSSNFIKLTTERISM